MSQVLSFYSLILSILLFFTTNRLNAQQKYLYGSGYGSTVNDPMMIEHLLDLTVGMGATSTGAGTENTQILD